MSKSKPILYRVILVVAKVAMGVFFQKVEVRRRESVPHSAIMDALGVLIKGKVMGFETSLKTS